MRAWLVFVAVCCLGSLSGCGDSSVADDLAQREANGIVAELREHGIEAVTQRERGGKGRYSVSVPSSRFGEAASILSELGLPAERQPSFTELVASSGILPNSREVEALRLDRASAAEIENLIGQHPSVSSVGAIVRIRSAPSPEAGSVSVVVQKREGEPLDELPLRDAVIRAVPGVKPDAIVVSIVERRALPKVSGGGREELVPFFLYWRVPQRDYGGLSILLLGLLLGVSGLAALAGYIYGQYSLSRHNDSIRAEALDIARTAPTITGRLPRSGEDADDASQEDPES